jgi:hypothetical protein
MKMFAKTNWRSALLADEPPGEIRISITALLIPLTIVLIGIGWLASPRDALGHPILLTPDVKAVEDYRRQAITWSRALRLDNGEMTVALADQTRGDLLTRSQQAQALFERTLHTAQTIDRQSAPPSLIGLREQLIGASTASLQSAQAILRWVSSPTPENETAARAYLAEAQTFGTSLEGSQWLTPPSR